MPAKTVRKIVRRSESVRFDGRTYPIFREVSGTWRLRSKTKRGVVQFGIPEHDLRRAKDYALRELENGKALPHAPATAKTLADLFALYLAAPKRASEDTAKDNVTAFRTVLDIAWGKAPEEVTTDKLGPALWAACVAKKQDRSAPDYSTRRIVNRAINTLIRKAQSLLIPQMRAVYKAAGIPVPDDAATSTSAPEVRLTPSAFDDAAFVKAWRDLRESNPPMWIACGLARFAGLRLSEILACRGTWIRTAGAATLVDLRDREEEGFLSKTGKPYSSLILDPVLAEHLAGLEPETLAFNVAKPLSRERWLERRPQLWLAQFGKAKKPLHRLRGLYADHVRRETEAAVLARQAAIKAASKALGHASTETTETHYLSLPTE